MKVIYSINARLAGGGIGDTGYYAALGTERAGHLQRVICSSYAGGQIPGERVHSLGLIGRALNRAAFIDRSGSLIRGVDIAFDYWAGTRLEGCDVLHCWSNLGRTLRRGKVFGAVTVLESMIHPATLNEILRIQTARWGIESAETPSAGRLARSLAEIETADFLSVPSEFVRSTFIARGHPDEKIRVIPYGVDTQRFRPRSPSHQSNREFRVLFVGNFTLRKGAPFVLEAWRLLGWNDAELWVVGNVAREMAEHVRAAQSLAGIIFLGFRRDPSDFYRGADVLLLPSLGEGSALVTYEAMASGLPVIVTENCGSVARHGIDGFICEAASSEAIAAALEEMRSNANMRSEMGRNARRQVEPYTWDSYGRRLVEAYSHLLAHRRPPID